MEAVFQTWPRLYLTAELGLVVEESPGDTGFEGMKLSWREAEPWHCVAGMESLKRTQEGLLVKVQASNSRDSSILEMLVLWDKNSRSEKVELARA